MRRKHVVDKLLRLAINMGDHRKGPPPGHFILKKLSPEEREVCKTLTSKDFDHFSQISG